MNLPTPFANLSSLLTYVDKADSKPVTKGELKKLLAAAKKIESGETLSYEDQCEITHLFRTPPKHVIPHP